MRWLARLCEQRRVRADASEEVAAHIEEKVADLVEAGVSEQEARHRAAREFGNAMLITERSREVWSWAWLERLGQDLRYALRGLRREPMLALAAALTLAICIGANTTVFSIANSILLKPLPYPGAEQIYWVSQKMGQGPEVGLGPDYYSLREENQVFEDVAAHDELTLNWTGVEQPTQLDASHVTPSFFRVMGTQPMLGRTFAPEEQGVKAPAVVVLSYPFWHTRLAGDQKVIGSTIILDRRPTTIIGVMPQGFDFPRGTQIWIPLDMDEATQTPRALTTQIRLIYILARRRPDVTEAQLTSEMARLTRSIHDKYPKDFETGGFLTGMKIYAVPLQLWITGDIRPALAVLSGAVGLVLLIACVNLANMLLARAGARTRELAVRMALGAGRTRIVKQVLMESLALALPGGLAGMAAAFAAVRLLNVWQPLVLQDYPPVTLDFMTLGFTLALTVVTGVAFGAAPALAAAGVNIQDSLKSASHTVSAGRRATRFRQVLVVGELAVSLVLMIGAGLLARTFVKLAETDLGFRAENLLTLRVNLTGSTYFTTAENQVRFYDEVLERVKRLPMVRQAATSVEIPLEGWSISHEVHVQVVGRPAVPALARPSVHVSVVSRDFFRTLEVPVRRGRVFNSQESRRSPGSIVINEAFARSIFPGENPLGHRIRSQDDSDQWTITGVVGNIRGGDLGSEPEPWIYRCNCQEREPLLMPSSLLIRTAGDPHAAIRAVEEQVRAVDRDLPAFDIKTMDERLADSLAPQRFHLVLIGAFALIALLLSAVGVYGVLSYLVTRRTREIGIRIAMGARPGEVRRLVVGESVVLAALAVVAGLAGAWALTRYLESMLYGVTALDSTTFSLMPVVLLALAIASSVLPAWRASRIDPMAALREE
jgi:putative ABC transport system permease protein